MGPDAGKEGGDDWADPSGGAAEEPVGASSTAGVGSPGAIGVAAFDASRWKESSGKQLTKQVSMLYDKFGAKSRTLFDEKQEEIIAQNAEKMQLRRKAAIRALEGRKGQKMALVNGAIYLAFTAFYFYIILAQRNITSAFKLEYAIKNYIDSADHEGLTYSDIGSMEDVWDWTENVLLDLLFPEQQWYNGDAYRPEEQNYVLEYNRLIGGFQIDQKRITMDDADCRSTTKYKGFYPHCWGEYSEALKMTAPYGPGHDEGKYRWTASDLGGSYNINVPLDGGIAKQTVRELKRDLWIDKSTREVMFKFTVYNGNLRMFSIVGMSVVFQPTGLVHADYKLQTFSMELYETPLDVVRAVFEVMFCAAIVWNFVGELLEMRAVGVGAYLADGWNIVDAARLSLQVAIAAIWVRIISHPQRLDLQLPLPAGQQFVTLDGVGKLFHTYSQLNAFSVIVCLMTVFKHLNTSPKYGILVRTILKAAPELLTFLSIWVLTFLTFAVMGMLMFGTALPEWNSIWSACQTLFMMVTGEYGYEPLWGIDPTTAPIFYGLYLVLCFFILVNILLAIMMDTYAGLQEMIAEDQERKADLTEVPLLTELFMQFRVKAAKVIPALEPEQVFVSNEDALEVLQSDPELHNHALKVRPEPTVNDPDPEEEDIVSYKLLKDNVPEEVAKLIMFMVGEPEGSHVEEDKGPSNIDLMARLDMMENLLRLLVENSEG